MPDISLCLYFQRVYSMAGRRLWCSQQRAHRNMGPAATADIIHLTTSQLCTHRPDVNYVQANACPCRAANLPCTSGFPSYNFRNQGPMRGPTAPSLTTNVRKTIEEAQEAAPTLWQAIAPVLFFQDPPAFSPSILLIGDDWPALPARADTAHTDPALTETAAPNPATPAAFRSGKINSNIARPTDSQIASPNPRADLDSDVTLVAIIVESDDNSDYAELAENSPMSPANTSDLEGHISKLEEIHEVVEGDLGAIAQPTVIFSHIKELKIPELNNAETKPPENHQDNGAMSPVNT